MKETIAELQARRQKLEQTVTGLKDKTDELSQARLQAAKAEIKEIDATVALEEKDAESAQLKAQKQARLERDAEDAVSEMVGQQKIPIRDTELQAQWKAKFVKDPDLIPLMTGRGSSPSEPGTALALSGRSAPLASSRDVQDRVDGASMLQGSQALVLSSRGSQISGGLNLRTAMRQYYEIVAENAKIKVADFRTRGDNFRRKAELAIQAAQVYKAILAPEVDAWQNFTPADLGAAIGLKAADYTDPNNNLGTLSGTLVLQRTMPFFAYQYPELTNMYTDFSDTPGLLNQTEMTRIVVQPAVQKYDPTLDAAGRPKGWGTVSAAQSTDVPLTLTDYVAVPIVFGNSMLASTMRRLFDEQAVLAIKALAGYFTGLVTNLATSQKYNAYAVAGATVPTAYATYAQGLQNFSMVDLDNIGAAFDSNKVPQNDRGVMLVPQYYAKLRADQRVILQYAAASKTVAGASDMLTEFKLPKLSGFAPYSSPYLPATTGTAPNLTNNVVGFAFQKAGVIVKSRLPQDFTQALGVMIPGSVTTVTDPDTGISLMLVQYVNLTSGYAEWRPEVMLGAAVGDNRAGLVLTSV